MFLISFQKNIMCNETWQSWTFKLDQLVLHQRCLPEMNACMLSIVPQISLTTGGTVALIKESLLSHTSKFSSKNQFQIVLNCIFIFLLFIKIAKRIRWLDPFLKRWGVRPVCPYAYILPLFPCTQSQMLLLIRYWSQPGNALRILSWDEAKSEK